MTSYVSRRLVPYMSTSQSTTGSTSEVISSCPNGLQPSSVGMLGQQQQQQHHHHNHHQGPLHQHQNTAVSSQQQQQQQQQQQNSIHDDGYGSLVYQNYNEDSYSMSMKALCDHLKEPNKQGILGTILPFQSVKECRPWNLYTVISEKNRPERPLGHGAFGVVWLCVDPRNQAQVALKRVPRVFHNQITAQRVYREIEILGQLSHQNIINLIDIALSSEYDSFKEVFFVFEVMQTDLHRIIASSQPLTKDHVKIFMYQILRGLTYIHSAGIIHRDIKPGNMLVNSNCLLKICDFGLARKFEFDRNEKLTHEVVTQYYRAPELLMESSWYSYEVDVWSAGCTFAELLARKILFPTSNPLVHLSMMLDLIGTDFILDDFDRCHQEAFRFVEKRLEQKQRATFESVFPEASVDAIALLKSMLSFSPADRCEAEKALNSPYLTESRLRFHSCMCTCCKNTYVMSCVERALKKERRYAQVLDPLHDKMIDLHDKFSCISKARFGIWNSTQKFNNSTNNKRRLVINKNALKFESFMATSVAKSKKNPHVHHW